MPAKKTASQPDRPALRVARDVAQSRIELRIAKGRELLNAEVHDEASLDSVRAKYYTWHEGNAALLRQLFTTDEIADDYAHWAGVAGGSPPLDRRIKYARDGISTSIRRLEGVVEKLEFIDEAESVERTSPVGGAAPDGPGNRVFIVHGRDEGRLRAVEAYLRQLGLDVTVLADRPSGGATLIEKIEKYGDVDYVVVLITPDDVGALRQESDEPELEPRARENVIFELGYFVGRLRRGRVAALVVDTPLPNDLGGFVYIPYGTDDGWKLRVVRELTAARIAVDNTRI